MRAPAVPCGKAPDGRKSPKTRARKRRRGRGRPLSGDPFGECDAAAFMEATRAHRSAQRVLTAGVEHMARAELILDALAVTPPPARRTRHACPAAWFHAMGPRSER